MSYTSPVFSEIGDDFIDIDFVESADENDKMTGYLPMTDEEINELYASELVRNFADDNKLIPESEWEDYIKKQDVNGGWLERRLVEMKDQKNEGSCVANATTTSHQIMQSNHWKGGDAVVRILSAISVYRECAPGPSTGSNVGTVMNQLRNVGAIPSNKSIIAKSDVAAGYYQVTHPDVGYYTKPSSNWKATAKFFRVDEWWRLKTLAEIISASLKGYPVIGARSRHCIVFVRWVIRSGKLYFIYANSWGEDWGETLQISNRAARGFGLDSQSTVASWAAREAWCPRTVINPSFLAL